MSGADQAQVIQQLETENARLRRLLDRHGMPSTLRHQVRNALGLMRAILRQSIAGKTSIEDYAGHVEGRFDALLRVQTALLSSPDERFDLTTLVADELLAQAIAEGERATIEGPDVRVDARQAELLGLVIHELATNAIKFGAMATDTGHVNVAWTVTALPKHLTLTWTETGGRHVAAPAVRGFGMETIEGMLPYQFKAQSRLEFLPEGLRCTIGLPLKPEKE